MCALCRTGYTQYDIECLGPWPKQREKSPEPYRYNESLSDEDIFEQLVYEEDRAAWREIEEERIREEDKAAWRELEVRQVYEEDRAAWRELQEFQQEEMTQMQRLFEEDMAAWREIQQTRVNSVARRLFAAVTGR